MSKRRNSDDLCQEQTKRQATKSSSAPNRFEELYTPIDSSNAVFSSSVQHLENRDFQDAIHSATVGFTNMFDNAIAFLDLRAAAYGLTVQIDKGLQDAEQIIKYAPTAATGYLRAGSLYTLSSKYKAAMQVYQQGIEALCDDQFLAERTVLQHKYDAAKVTAERRSDFITKMPYDLISTIMEYLPPVTLAQALNVSRSWRNYIVSNKKVWSSMIIDSSLGKDTINPMVNALSRVNHHVQIMRLVLLSSTQSEQIFLDMMDGGYTQLKSLHIASYIENYGRSMIALSQVKNTLKELVLDFDRFSFGMPPLFPLGVVLSTCKNLSKLHCCQRYGHVPDESAFGLIPIKPSDSLVDLVLRFLKINNILLEKILHCCPELQQLAVSHCDTSAIGIIRRSCPKLYNLGVNDNNVNLDKNELNHLSSQPHDQNNGNGNDSNEIPGVHHLVLDLSETKEFTDHEPLDLLSTNSHSLETLDLRFSRLLDDTQQQQDVIRAQWAPLTTSISFSSLRRLALAFDTFLTHAIIGILSNCPLLEALELNRCNLTDVEILQTIPQLAILQELQLRDIFEVNEEGLISMFQAFAQRDKYPLQILNLIENGFEFSHAIMESIALIRSLQNVCLDDLIIEKTSFERFVRVLADGQNQLPSSVQTMSLRSVDGIDDEGIRHIRDIESLRTLKIYHLWNVTVAGLDYVGSKKKITLEF